MLGVVNESIAMVWHGAMAIEGVVVTTTLFCGISELCPISPEKQPVSRTETVIRPVRRENCVVIMVLHKCCAYIYMISYFGKVKVKELMHYRPNS